MYTYVYLHIDMRLCMHYACFEARHADLPGGFKADLQPKTQCSRRYRRLQFTSQPSLRARLLHAWAEGRPAIEPHLPLEGWHSLITVSLNSV